MTHPDSSRPADDRNSKHHADLTALTDDERSQLEHRLVDFDRHWRVGALVEAMRGLPVTPVRWVAIVEMVKIDLEKRWQRGEQPTLNEYRVAIPELGDKNDWPAELIFTEFQLRQEHATTPSLQEYLADYPVQAARLRHLVDAGVTIPLPTGKKSEASGPDTNTFVAHARDHSTSRPTLPRLEPGGTFGRYRIKKLLGRGGMGSVYLAHDPKLERDVALKIPSPEMHVDQRATEFTLREARAAAGLHHPNICPVYDVGDIDGVPFITSRFIEGEPLSAIALRTPPMAEKDAARLVALVARAIDHAHRHGVIHRDLKPANIILESSGQPIVMDFGLARQLQPDFDTQVSLSGLAGSPAYMAPEQVAETRAGPASDIFSLGVVLYELLTGRVPFLGTISEILQQVVSTPVPPPSRFRPGLDLRLEAVCLRALSKNRHERFQTMGEFADALESIAGTRQRSHTRWLAVAGALIVVGAICLVVWNPFRKPARLDPSTGGGGGGVATVTGGGNGGTVNPKPLEKPGPRPEYVPAYKQAKGYDPSDFKLRKKPLEFQQPTTVEGWIEGLDTWHAPEEGTDKRLVAIEALARLGDRKAIAPLVRKMLDEPGKTHWSERRECAAALAYLGWDGNPDVADALFKRIADRWWLRETRNGEHQWRNPFGTQYQDPDHGGKESALQGLRSVDPTKVEAALRLALQQTKRPPAGDENHCGEPHLIRAWAAERLVDHNTPDTVKALATALLDANGLVRRRAAESLAKLKAPAAIDALTQRVADGTWMEEHFESLVGEQYGMSYSDPVWGGKADALKALAAIASRDEVAAALHDAEKSSNPNVVKWAAGELAKRKSPKSEK